MINETKQRIEAYKAALPGIKERVVAALLLLVVSLSMVVSASFAWITLSQSPEATDIATNVTSNGNLEIALVNPAGTLPEESKVGDSAATTGQTLVNANLTWGNMVNLSDASYGLQAISLRPALLSGFNLTKNPLYGATYGEDGRVISTSDVYEYVTYTQDINGKYYFAATSSLSENCYGVRGIASIKYDNTTADATIEYMQSQIRTAYSRTNSIYFNIIDGTTKVDEVRNISCMNALEMLMDIYVNEKADNVLDTTGTTIYADYSGVVTYAYRLMQEFRKVLDAEGEALLLLANLQIYANDPTKTTEYFATVDELLAASNKWSSLGVSLESLSTYKANCTNLDSAIAGLKPYAEAFDPDTGTGSYTYTDSSGEEVTITEVYWSKHISTHVNKLVKIETTEINGLPMSSFNGSNVSSVLGVLNASSHNVVIKDGILADTEQRIGDLLATNSVKVSVTVNALNKKINATVATDATSPFLCNVDMGNVFSSRVQGPGTDAVAQDTYGIAIDMWVRTNAQGAILTLEGNLQTELVDATCTDKNGDQAVLYTMIDEDTLTDVYQLTETEDGVDVINWYSATSNTKIGSNTELTDEGYTFEKQQKEVVVGFTGENRVWENWDEMEKDITEGMIDANFSTQGSGSCYVFYAETEADRVRILDMLKAFTIAFLDQNGTHIATAKLDTEHAYTINGKVTVPMKMVAGVTYTDEDGNTHIGITSLVRDTATWITAVVYLDGMQMTNEDVLAVGEIEGRLNLQYGSSVSLSNPENSELANQYREFTAVATSDAGSSSGINSPITYDYDATAKTITVTVTPTGDQPGTISGFFIRAISATQGSKEKTVEFTKNSDGTWSGTFELTKPGTYSFRSVIADGVEYDLNSFPTVTISGLGISYVSCDLPTGVSMTSDSYIEANVTLTIDADETVMPNQVRAQFWSDDDKVVNAILSYDSVSGQWRGKVKFTESGAYTLTYVIMDGDETLLADSQQTTHVLYLGITAKVMTTYSPLEFMYDPEVTVNFPMRVELFDNAGNELTGLENVWLYYRVSGSVIDQGGMKDEVVWNKNSGFYEGTFTLPSPGVFVFNRVAISETEEDDTPTSIIYNAASYPTFTAISPNPPEYIDGAATEAYQFVPDGGATMAVDMKYADTAVVWALLENQNGEQYMVKGDRTPLGDDMFRFTFDVPTNAAGKQDGEWTIQALAVQGVYIKDEGKMYSLTETEPTVENYDNGSCYIFDVASDKVTAYVVHTVNVSVANGDDAYTGETFGATDTNGNGTIESSEITGAFMDSYTVNDLTFIITDWNGEGITGLTDPTWTITYGDNSLFYGGYTTDSALAPVAISLSGSGTTYTLPAAQTFQRAGTYVAVLSFKVDGSVYTDNAYTHKDAVNYAVWSITPSVTVSADTSTTFDTRITWRRRGSKYTGYYLEYTLSGSQSNILNATNNEVTVYAEATTEASIVGNGDAGFIYPTVTFTTAGFDSSSEVKFTISGGSVTDKSVTIDGNTSSTVTLGSGGVAYNMGQGFLGITYTAYSYLGHGDAAEIDKVTVVRNGVTYTVYLENSIKIHNPSSVNQTS